MRCSKRALALLVLMSPAVHAAVVPKTLREVEAKYAQAGTLIAKFTQVQKSAASGKETTSYGMIFVKPPGRLRWETLKPDQNLLVSDGKTIWYYTPPFDEGESGQLIERKASEVQSHFAQALLSGAISKQKGFKIQSLGRGKYVLTPKKGTAGTVLRAEIEVDRSKHLITKVLLKHKGGNQAEITLKDIELGKTIEDQLFQFAKPPNTEKID